MASITIKREHLADVIKEHIDSKRSTLYGRSYVVAGDDCKDSRAKCEDWLQNEVTAILDRLDIEVTPPPHPNQTELPVFGATLEANGLHPE